MPADRTTRDCVAEALRAAVNAVWIGVQPGEREYQDAARIVSAFLRALPADRALWLRTGSHAEIALPPFWEHVAAAVERAAEEKR